jgi:uncharacterized membrane protein
VGVASRAAILPAKIRALDPVLILAVLSLIVAGSEWLARRGVFRHLGTALLVILIGAVAANTGVLPAGSTAQAPVPVYDAIFAYVAPLALFWLLLSVNLRDVIKAGVPLLLLFLLGSAATAAGAVLAMRLVGGEAAIGPLHHAVAGMFTGTYTGGSVNFNAVALEYDVVRDGVLYGGAVVVDNIVTTVWIAATLMIPRVLGPVWSRRLERGRPAASATGDQAAPAAAAVPIVDLAAEIETIDPRRLALVLALGGAALWLSNGLAAWAAGAWLRVPSILIITAIALVLAQVRLVSQLPGARVVGMFAVYLFLTVIGAFCDVHALGRLGDIGAPLLAFASITVALHGLVLFGGAWLFRLDLAAAAVASQANVGGGTTALALAKSLGREDLLVPGILLGSVGNGIGTFLGFLVAGLA